MYNSQKRGYGVYHSPIVELGKKYYKEGVIDLTGLEFEDILYFIKQGYSIWIITNGTYKPLEEEYFEIWHTLTGIVKITYKLHSVSITGYEEDSIYINDTLNNKPNRKLEREGFKKAWEQIGQQAVVLIK